MTSFRKYKVLLITCVLLSACALPAPEKGRQEFIPDLELTIVSLVEQGLSYYGRSRLIEAELYLRQAQYLAPDEEHITFNLAVVLERQGLFDESIAIYTKLLEGKPYSIRYLSGLAHVYLTLGTFSEAEKIYLEALELAIERDDPIKMTNLARNISVLYFRLGDEEQALCYSDLAASFSADREQIKRQARLLIALEYYQPAIKVLEEFMSKQEVLLDSGLLAPLAMANYGLENYQQALDVAQKALGARNIDFIDQYELELVEAVCLHMQEQMAKEALTEEAEALAEQEEEEEEQSILANSPLENSSAIYWPTNMLEKLAEIELEFEALEEGEEANNPEVKGVSITAEIAEATENGKIK
ncbi:tetratricopeptide repeat protein [Oligoflexia bacterium]|nr:tetratricopeptide repeat protein [Oligoflexia bacterium]